MDIYPIETEGRGSLAIMPMPPGHGYLFTAIKTLKSEGFSKVISLLEPAESLKLGLADQSELCGNQGLLFENFAIADYQVPECMQHFDRFIDRLVQSVLDGEHTVVHCRAGIGRSGLVAISALVVLQIELSQAIAQVASARGKDVPETQAQRCWLDNYVHYRRREAAP